MKGKAVWFLAGLCAALIVGYVAWSASPSRERQMRRLTDELITSLPRRVEPKTTRTWSLSISGNYVIFIYSLQDYSIGELTPDEVLGLRASVASKLINYAPTLGGPKKSGGDRVIFHYICMDKNGEVLFEIEMPPSKYL